LEILIIQHLSRQSQDQKFSFIKEKIFIKVGISQGHIQKGLQEYLYINHCGIPWPIASYSINFFSQEDSKKHRKDPDAPESADEGDTQVEYSSD